MNHYLSAIGFITLLVVSYVTGDDIKSEGQKQKSPDSFSSISELLSTSAGKRPSNTLVEKQCIIKIQTTVQHVGVCKNLLDNRKACLSGEWMDPVNADCNDDIDNQK